MAPEHILLAHVQREPVQNDGVQQGIEDPHPEHLDVEQLGLLRRLVQLGVLEHGLGGARAVEQPHGQRRPRREHHVVQADGPALEQDLAGPARIDREPQLNHVQANVLVETVED